INYAIQNNRIAKDYLINYTNAAFIVKDGFKLPEDGLFSGFDGHTYSKDTWNYEEGGNVGPKAEGAAAATTPSTGAGKTSSKTTGAQNQTSQVNSQPSTSPKGSPAQGGGHQA